MRVLFLAREFPPFEVGGAGKHTYHLIRSLKKLGVICDVLSFGASDSSSAGIHFVDPHSSIICKTESSITEDVRIPLDILRISRIARRLIQKEDFDILHVEEPYVGALVNHSRKVTTIHDTGYGEIKPLLCHLNSLAQIKRVAFYASLGFLSELVSTSSSRRLIVPFSHVKMELMEAYGVSEKKMSIIHNGVEFHEKITAYEKNRTKEKLGLIASDTLIFTAARHVPRKRLETLVRAAALLRNEHVGHFRTIIAGDGPSKGDIDRLIKRLDLSGIVRTVGWVSEEQLAMYYKAADIFVLTSEYETGPISLLEAMSYGNCVVSSKIHGFPLLMNDGVDGLLFPVGDSMSLSSCLKSLIDDDEQRVKLSASGRLFAERFNWDDVAKQTLNLYRSLY